MWNFRVDEYNHLFEALVTTQYNCHDSPNTLPQISTYLSDESHDRKSFQRSEKLRCSRFCFWDDITKNIDILISYQRAESFSFFL